MHRARESRAVWDLQSHSSRKTILLWAWHCCEEETKAFRIALQEGFLTESYLQDQMSQAVPTGGRFVQLWM